MKLSLKENGILTKVGFIVPMELGLMIDYRLHPDIVSGQQELMIGNQKLDMPSTVVMPNFKQMKMRF